METQTAIEIIKKGGTRFRIVGAHGTLVKRLFVSGERVAEFHKGSSRRGYAVDPTSWLSLESAEISNKEAWEKSWKTVEKELAISGLNPDVLKDVRLALDLGYDKVQLAYNASHDNTPDISYEERHKRETEAVLAVDSRLAVPGEGFRFNTTVLWHMCAPAKIKSMYFGKADNVSCKGKIRQSLLEKTMATVSGRASYDCSFYFEPEHMRATYSEEYRNCGNGHYYLAISADRAVFWEDD